MRALIQARLCPCCGAACAVAARPAAPAEADSLKAQIACLDSPPASRSEQVRLGFADSKGSTILIGLASFKLFLSLATCMKRVQEDEHTIRFKKLNTRGMIMEDHEKDRERQ